jgi:glycosyltransferase involved in cell wall biosynthesis
MSTYQWSERAWRRISISFKSDSKSDLVTIFTPTINPFWMLQRAYESLVRQTHQNLQWIVISDASTEDVPSLIKRLSPAFETVYLENETRLGKAICYNMAIEIAKGDFFCILDDDDELLPDAIANLLQVWNQIPSPARVGYWGVAGMSVVLENPETSFDAKSSVVKSNIEYTYLDSGYDEMRFRFGQSDEKFSLTVTEIVKRFPYDPVTFHIPPSAVWSKVSRSYSMRYTDLTVRVYHQSPNGIMSRKRTYQVLLQRTLGIVLWTSDDLNYNFKYFRFDPKYFLKATGAVCPPPAGPNTSGMESLYKKVPNFRFAHVTWCAMSKFSALCSAAANL